VVVAAAALAVDVDDAEGAVRVDLVDLTVARVAIALALHGAGARRHGAPGRGDGPLRLGLGDALALHGRRGRERGGRPPRRRGRRGRRRGRAGQLDGGRRGEVVISPADRSSARVAGDDQPSGQQDHEPSSLAFPYGSAMNR